MRYVKKNKTLMREWHTWFAWRPVRIECDDGTYFVWLEKVERRYYTKYRHSMFSVSGYTEHDATEYRLPQ